MVIRITRALCSNRAHLAHLLREWGLLEEQATGFRSGVKGLQAHLRRNSSKTVVGNPKSRFQCLNCPRIAKRCCLARCAGRALNSTD